MNEPATECAANSAQATTSKQQFYSETSRLTNTSLSPHSTLTRFVIRDSAKISLSLFLATGTNQANESDEPCR